VPESVSLLKIRRTTLDDLSAILTLYRSVAAFPGGLARLADEVDESWVNEFLTRSRANGLCLVAEAESGRIVGEIHSYSPELHCFSHVLTGLTIAVAPDAQGRGLGRLLFETFMRDVVETRPDIRRVELISRESNRKAIQFYESLGFRIEGELVDRILNVDGSLESDIPMAWTRS
jgi:ribosomal protein S18 acetylase RimI-like enzyme